MLKEPTASSPAPFTPGARKGHNRKAAWERYRWQGAQTPTFRGPLTTRLAMMTETVGAPARIQPKSPGRLRWKRAQTPTLIGNAGDVGLTKLAA